LEQQIAYRKIDQRNGFFSFLVLPVVRKKVFWKSGVHHDIVLPMLLSDCENKREFQVQIAFSFIEETSNCYGNNIS
jgi:hypothetical protein